jgi:mono/diheme cytochrome c family protein
VRVSPDIGPATVGLLTPRIVIPRWATALPRQELELVLHHEAEHVRSRDTLLLALGLAAVVACPWNPLVWWQVRRLKAAVEVDCDRRVLRNGVAPARYGDLLVRLGIAGRLGSLLVPTIAGSTSLLERRLTAMTNMRRRISVPRAVGAIALALLLVGVACTADPPVATDRRATELTEESRVDNSTELEQTLRREAGEVTYIDDVAGILTQNCQICHQKGGVGSMALVSYDDVRPWAHMIKVLVNRAPLADHYELDVLKQGLENDGRLSAEEIRTITAWVDAGAPMDGAGNIPSASSR